MGAITLAAAAAGMAAMLGCWLAVIHLQPPPRRAPPGLLRLAHGGLGTATVAAMLFGLWRAGFSASVFAWDALGLLGLALALGLLAWRRGNGTVMALHAFAAMVGLVLLVGWAVAG